MTTRAQLRTLVRRQLNDTGGAPLWTDDLLNDWLAEAIRVYSRQAPQEATTTVAVTAGQASYPLPADLVQVMRVEQPTGVVRITGSRSRPVSSGSGAPGEAPLQAGWPGAYRVVGGSLVLDPPPSGAGPEADIRLEYLRFYPTPSADGDVLATPPVDDEVLVHLVSAMALEWVAGDEAKRLRYRDSRGASPLEQARQLRARATEALRARSERVRAGTLELA